MKFFIAALMLSVVCSNAFSAPDVNPSPQDQINVIGTIPEYVEAVTTEEWYTTNRSIFCEKMRGEGGFFADHFSKPTKLISATNEQRTWTVGRDEVLAGSCGWTLKAIVVFLDTKASGLSPVRASNVPTRIAVVCDPREHCENNWAIDDDAAKPTFHYCKFSTIKSLPPSGNSSNPCIYFQGKYRGTDEGKYEHILRQGQRAVRFVITDLEKPTP